MNECWHQWARYGERGVPFVHVSGSEGDGLDICKRCGETRWLGDKSVVLAALFPENRATIGGNEK